MKILILASNPRKDFNLDREIRDLKGVIEKSRDRQEFEVEDALAVRVGDLQDLLFRHRPQIVHFCGHGSGQQGLVFEGNDGGEQWVRAEALSDLFRLFSENVGCVLLNACYSEEQANAIVNHIDYVIGMNQEIRDDAAIAFSKGFYRALGYKCSIEQAYEFGKNAIQLEISGSSKMRSVATEEIARKAEVVGAIEQIAIPEHLKPILKMKPTLTRSSRANITAPEQPLLPETRVAIQLDIDKSLEVDVKAKQYRDRVREFLGDRKLSTLDTIRLERLRKDLGLSETEANQ
ncbi:MAG: CHAT domain-containing protein, partial [Phormidesmis sp. CAN_BIN44]|nr:CHAT domain-containing protein [Phormidesmis sp. CAN_BIN44]